MTFREQLLTFLKGDSDRWDDQVPKPGDHEKYDLNPALVSSIHVCTAGPSEVVFHFDKDGNLLEIDSYILLEDQALLEIAKHPALDEAHSNTLICSACHIQEYDATSHPETKQEEPAEVVEKKPVKKDYLN